MVLGVGLVVAVIGALVALAVAGGDDDESAASTATETDTSSELDAGSDDETDREPSTESDTDLAAGRQEEMSVGAEELARSVVQIRLLLEGESVCTGSGTIIDADGTVLTNFHVVEQSPICPHDTIAIAVAESSGAVPELLYSADLLVADTELDLAVLRVGSTLDGSTIDGDFAPVGLGDSSGVALGDELRVIGFPGIGGETVTFTTGSVSGFVQSPDGDERRWIKTDATIAGGNSGGLVADDDGRMVGIPTRVGTGDGEIVDCRVITDSNGDGELTGDDTCVPIGGFINGIRPLALALPLIDAAKTATPIDQGPPERPDPISETFPFASDAVWSSDVDTDGRAIDDLAAAVNGLPQLCLTWDYEDITPGSVAVEEWYHDGEFIDSRNDVVPDDDTGEGNAWACLTADDGLSAGVYEFVWLIDDELVFANGILVGDGETATVEVVNTSDVALCVVQLDPNGTSNWGLNRLDSSLEPGEAFRTAVGVGDIDVRVLDCNGEVRIEEAPGESVNGELSIEVP